MKKLMLLMLVLSIIPTLALGQLKRQNEAIDIKSAIIEPLSNSISGIGLIDPSKLSMSHSFSMSYFSFGGNSLSQSMYLNTIRYQIADPLTFRIQWGIQNFPHNNTMMANHPAFKGGPFISGAELDYRPTDNIQVKFQYSRMPGYYDRYRNPYYSPFNNFWDTDE
ncbi:hypothetical protein GF337_17305 [candidate division KSB1 bacterium]|nr:hypothetical protein [candidate division KSB1 bacterium]